MLQKGYLRNLRGVKPTGGFADVYRVIFNVVFLVIPPYTAEMVADLFRVTAEVETLNVAFELPDDTVTLAGTVADVELSLNITTTPPLGAGTLNVTVPTEAVPPLTVAGLSESELNAVTTVIVTVASILLVTPSLARYVKLSLPT